MTSRIAPRALMEKGQVEGPLLQQFDEEQQ